MGNFCKGENAGAKTNLSGNLTVERLCGYYKEKAVCGSDRKRRNFSCKIKN